MPGCCGGITGFPHAGFSPPGGYASPMLQISPQERVVRSLVQQNTTSKAYKWPLLTTGTPWKLLNTKKWNSSSSFSFFSFSSAIYCTRETKTKTPKHTQEEWACTASYGSPVLLVTVHSKRGICSVRNGTEIRGICCCSSSSWTPVCRNSSTTIKDGEDSISTNFCFKVPALLLGRRRTLVQALPWFSTCSLGLLRSFSYTEKHLLHHLMIITKWPYFGSITKLRAPKKNQMPTWINNLCELRAWIF
jgi:hypothetical protein